jgi:alpha-tubulin suppressor-like RCC1 family protein
LSCLLNSWGRVFCWGLGVDGQLGNGTAPAASPPVRVHGLTNAIKITVGGRHVCALVASGRELCWGRNDDGQVGIGGGPSYVLVPSAPVIGLRNVVDIGAGDAHSLAVLKDGTTWAWGLNANGDLGDGTTRSSGIPVAVQ